MEFKWITRNHHLCWYAMLSRWQQGSHTPSDCQFGWFPSLPWIQGNRHKRPDWECVPPCLCGSAFWTCCKTFEESWPRRYGPEESSEGQSWWLKALSLSQDTSSVDVLMHLSDCLEITEIPKAIYCVFTKNLATNVRRKSYPFAVSLLSLPYWGDFSMLSTSWVSTGDLMY